MGVWLPDGLAEGPVDKVVGETVGRASMCWVGGTGGLTFDDQDAATVADGLIAYLNAWAEDIRKEFTARIGELEAKDTRPNLALADTRTLLREVMARGNNGWREEGNASAYRLAWTTKELLEQLDQRTLNYRPVDGG